jgi:serine protease AprX
VTNHPKRHGITLAGLCVALAATALFPVKPAAASSSPLVSVIVREDAGSTLDAGKVIASLGGQVTGRIDIINGVSARVPALNVTRLAATPGILSVTPDSPGHLLSTYAPSTDTGSMLTAEQRTGARATWSAGYTGKGIDIALIDSGVAPVNGLTAPGKVINGPDFSLESPADNLRYLDTYGHGTHMAGIIAGRDNVTTTPYASDTTHFMGMAPDSRIVSLKVADANGNTDVSQILMAIDWVIHHRNDNGMNIRVLNLSFGTDATQGYALDPLAYATEVAWHDGIVVVAAAGNSGNGAVLTDPAYDPTILAVGAGSAPATVTSTLSTDLVATFSSALATATRHADLVAPGSHVQSLRDPGSSIDQLYFSTGDIDTRFFRGSGTSQAAAMVSGAAALIEQQHPGISPDQVKALLKVTATPINATSYAQGSGELNLKAALTHSVPSGTQNNVVSTGLGTVEGSRGTGHLVQNGVTLSGEQDIFGNTMTSQALAQSESGLWTSLDGEWLDGWWSATSWAGASWAIYGSQQSLWSGAAWVNPNWVSHSWSATGWDSHSWSDGAWSSHSWSSVGYSSHSWSRETWS